MEEKHPLSNVIFESNASFEEVLQFLFNVDDDFRKSNLGKLRIQMNELEKEVVMDSPYEIHKGSEYANSETKYQKATISRFIPKTEVNAAIDKFAKPEMVTEIKDHMEKKYPTERWEDVFPYASTLNILYNKFLRDNRK